MEKVGEKDNVVGEDQEGKKAKKAPSIEEQPHHQAIVKASAKTAKKENEKGGLKQMQLSLFTKKQPPAVTPIKATEKLVEEEEVKKEKNEATDDKPKKEKRSGKVGTSRNEILDSAAHVQDSPPGGSEPCLPINKPQDAPREAEESVLLHVPHELDGRANEKEKGRKSSATPSSFPAVANDNPNACDDQKISYEFVESEGSPSPMAQSKTQSITSHRRRRQKSTKNDDDEADGTIVEEASTSLSVSIVEPNGIPIPPCSLPLGKPQQGEMMMVQPPRKRENIKVTTSTSNGAVRLDGSSTAETAAFLNWHRTLQKTMNDQSKTKKSTEKVFTFIDSDDDSLQEESKEEKLIRGRKKNLRQKMQSSSSSQQHRAELIKSCCGNDDEGSALPTTCLLPMSFMVQTYHRWLNAQFDGVPLLLSQSHKHGTSGTDEAGKTTRNATIAQSRSLLQIEEDEENQKRISSFSGKKEKKTRSNSWGRHLIDDATTDDDNDGQEKGVLVELEEEKREEESIDEELLFFMAMVDAVWSILYPYPTLQTEKQREIHKKELAMDCLKYFQLHCQQAGGAASNSNSTTISSTHQLWTSKYPPMRFTASSYSPVIPSSSFTKEEERLIQWLSTWKKQQVDEEACRQQNGGFSSPSRGETEGGPLSPTPLKCASPLMGGGGGLLSPSFPESPAAAPDVDCTYWIDDRGHRRSARQARREQMEMERQLKEEEERKKIKGYYAGSDIGETGQLSNIAVLQGHSGIGKTACVYSAAMQAGYQVVEINPAMKRCSKLIEKVFSEATQSKQIHSGGYGTKSTASILEDLKKLATMTAAEEQEKEGKVENIPQQIVASEEKETGVKKKQQVVGGGGKHKANTISKDAVHNFFFGGVKKTTPAAAPVVGKDTTKTDETKKKVVEQKPATVTIDDDADGQQKKKDDSSKKKMNLKKKAFSSSIAISDDDIDNDDDTIVVIQESKKKNQQQKSCCKKKNAALKKEIETKETKEGGEECSVTDDDDGDGDARRDGIVLLPSPVVPGKKESKKHKKEHHHVVSSSSEKDEEELEGNLLNPESGGGGDVKKEVKKENVKKELDAGVLASIPSITTTTSSSSLNTLVLLESGDIIFDDEHGLYPAVRKMAQLSKCPVIVTVNEGISEQEVSTAFGDGAPLVPMQGPSRLHLILEILTILMSECDILTKIQLPSTSSSATALPKGEKEDKMLLSLNPEKVAKVIAVLQSKNTAARRKFEGRQCGESKRKEGNSALHDRSQLFDNLIMALHHFVQENFHPNEEEGANMQQQETVGEEAQKKDKNFVSLRHTFDIRRILLQLQYEVLLMATLPLKASDNTESDICIIGIKRMKNIVVDDDEEDDEDTEAPSRKLKRIEEVDETENLLLFPSGENSGVGKHALAIWGIDTTLYALYASLFASYRMDIQKLLRMESDLSLEVYGNVFGTEDDEIWKENRIQMWERIEIEERERQLQLQQQKKCQKNSTAASSSSNKKNDVAQPKPKNVPAKKSVGRPKKKLVKKKNEDEDSESSSSEEAESSSSGSASSSSRCSDSNSSSSEASVPKGQKRKRKQKRLAKGSKKAANPPSSTGCKSGEKKVASGTPLLATNNSNVANNNNNNKVNGHTTTSTMSSSSIQNFFFSSSSAASKTMLTQQQSATASTMDASPTQTVANGIKTNNQIEWMSLLIWAAHWTYASPSFSPSSLFRKTLIAHADAVKCFESEYNCNDETRLQNEIMKVEENAKFYHHHSSLHRSLDRSDSRRQDDQNAKLSVSSIHDFFHIWYDAPLMEALSSSTTISEEGKEEEGGIPHTTSHFQFQKITSSFSFSPSRYFSACQTPLTLLRMFLEENNQLDEFREEKLYALLESKGPIYYKRGCSMKFLKSVATRDVVALNDFLASFKMMGRLNNGK